MVKRNVVLVLALVLTLTGCSLGVVAAAKDALNLDEPEISKDQRLADLGHAALSKGNYGLAEAYLGAALEANPSNPYALHNLGVVYYQTNRKDKARELYSRLVAFDPTATLPAPGEDAADKGAPMVPGGIVEAAPTDPASPPVFEAPMFEAPAVAAVQLESKPESTVLERFATLARLRDAGLISPAEYAERRGANLGALTPMTGPAPSATLSRPAPPAEDVIGRLRTIGAFRAAGALSDTEFKAERIAILDALMPVIGGNAPFPATARATAALRLANRSPIDDVIERTELMAMAGPATPATNPIETTKVAPISAVPNYPPASYPPTSYPPAPAAAPTAPVMAMTGVGPAFGVHIASYRSPERARQGWSVLRDAHDDIFGGLESRVARVDLGPGTGVYFRLRAGPLADEAAARTLCRELKRRDLYCVPSVF